MVTWQRRKMRINMAEKKDEDKTLPFLVTKDRKYQTVHATFVDAKGLTNYAVKYLAGVYKLIGAQKILGWTDGEPAVKKA